MRDLHSGKPGIVHACRRRTGCTDATYETSSQATEPVFVPHTRITAHGALHMIRDVQDVNLADQAVLIRRSVVLVLGNSPLASILKRGTITRRTEGRGRERVARTISRNGAGPGRGPG